MSFSFGGTPASTSGSENKPSLFGTSGQASSGNLFGGGSGSTSSPFNLGGNKPSGGNLFGGASQGTPASTGGSLFGNPATSGGEHKPLFGASGAGTTGGLFGGGTSSTPAAASPSGFSFGQKPAEANTASTAPATGTTAPTTSGSGMSSLFGSVGGNKPSGLFGQGSSSTPSGQSPFGGQGAANQPSASPASTPAPSKTGFALGSTTPAAPPPSNASGGFFGAQSSQQPTQQSSGNAPTLSLFGQNKPATTQAASGGPSLFGATGTSGTPNPFGAAGGNKPATPSLFSPQPSSQASAPSSTSATTGNAQAHGGPKNASTLFGSAPSSTPQQPAQGSPSLFGNLGGSSTPQASTSASIPTLTFSSATSTQAPASGAPASTSASTTSGATPSLFGNTGGATSQPAASSAAITPSLFGGLSQKKDDTPASTQAAPSATTTTGAPSSLFAGMQSTSTTSAAPGTTAAGATAGPSTTTAGTTGTPSLGASTMGPAPPAASRLKNKSMEDILTRWSADLSKYQKEFKKQADTVAGWDRALVENSDKILKLYNKTIQAERDSAEVQKQLSIVEDQQDELGQWLDKYEKEVDEMMGRIGGNDGGLQGPDQERDRTYKLAERLTDKLSGLNSDLGDVIGEINSVSSMLSKSSNPDDPLSQVVRVLNSHLQQLQTIDAGTTDLHGRIAAAQQEAKRTGANGYHGIGSDPAEDFSRSFLSGRR